MSEVIIGYLNGYVYHTIVCLFLFIHVLFDQLISLWNVLRWRWGCTDNVFAGGKASHGDKEPRLQSQCCLEQANNSPTGCH